MLAIRLSWRSSTPSCLRTSRLAAVGWLEKSLGATRIVSWLTAAGSPPASATRSRRART